MCVFYIFVFNQCSSLGGFVSFLTKNIASYVVLLVLNICLILNLFQMYIEHWSPCGGGQENALPDLQQEEHTDSGLAQLLHSEIYPSFSSRCPQGLIMTGVL